MAEIAGLVVGIVGVAGVVSAFKDAIDLFNDFASSREFGRDYEILDTKVDIERAILLQWAENVRLLRSDYDRRLDNDVTQRAIGGILGCIKLLMGDEAQLRARYGLKEDDQRVRGKTCSTAVISGPRMAKFVQEFEAMRLRSKILDKTTSFNKKIRWVIRDKEKFEELARELAHFTTKLTQIVPAFTSEESAQRASYRDISAVNSLRELKLIFDASVERRLPIAELTQEHIIHTCQEQILRRLWFRTIDLRKDSVSQAHSKTFHWALEPPKQDSAWHDLPKWLLHGSGIYWISGKAGSGKSTLMKYVYQHEKTATFLSQWAGDIPCYKHHFFFWNMGTYEQKSQEGLSRALLYQILSNHPSLIKEALPNMWKQCYDNEAEIFPPSLPEAKYAFHVLATKTSEIGKFCFFIDGLDEFAGDYQQGITFIQELARNHHIKIIVSSRPIPECVASFESLPSLQLHHLTHDDIKAYVEDVVGRHKYMEGLFARQPNESAAIIEYLVTKSSGVFLWVILACRSLLSGFADYDRIDELQQRVDELPPELETMFQHMLNKINKRHREQSARMLRICYTNTQARDRCEVGGLSSFGLALMDNNYKSREQISTLTTEQKRRLCEELEGRLRSRTGGLLETCWSVRKECHDAKIDGRVEFMHRTVFEFLSNEKSWNLECFQPPNGFQVATDLSLICLYSATASLPGGDPQANRFLRDGFQWGAQADRQDSKGRENIFYVLSPFLKYISSKDSIGDDMLSRIIISMRRYNDASVVPRTVLLLAVEAGAVNFVKGHLSSQHNSRLLVPRSNMVSRLLYHSVSFSLIGHNTIWQYENDRLGIVSTDMVSLLLKNGANPNYTAVDTIPRTPWSLWLSSMEGKATDFHDKLLVAEITELFVQHDAKLFSEFCRWLQILRKSMNWKTL
ncbi:prion-inhibition and propagation-domain-containing protein [Annulohypoxylon moriforme]|nr:prion-inhibition and propagation-domain-containing protein [Annulohypoxylon moriforme]